jgi:hypothetical protein
VKLTLNYKIQMTVYLLLWMFLDLDQDLLHLAAAVMPVLLIHLLFSQKAENEKGKLIILWHDRI